MKYFNLKNIISIYACIFDVILREWMAACVFTGFTMQLEFGMVWRSHLHSQSIAGCCRRHDGVTKPFIVKEDRASAQMISVRRQFSERRLGCWRAVALNEVQASSVRPGSQQWSALQFGRSCILSLFYEN